MAKVITYSNSPLTCYSTIQLDNGDNIFISIAGTPTPSVRISKTRLLGLVKSAIWEFTPQMAGGYEAYVRKMMRAFADASKGPQHPLDAIKDLVLSCDSTSEVIDKLFAAERRMDIPLPDED